MKMRRDYQIPCPACRAGKGNPCKNKEGQRLPGVHLQRTQALRAAHMAAFKALYAPLQSQRYPSTLSQVISR